MTAGIFASAGNRSAANFFASTVSGTPSEKQAISADGIVWANCGSNTTLGISGNTSRFTLVNNEKWLLSKNVLVSVDRNGSTNVATPSTGLSVSYSGCFGNGKYVAVGVQGGSFKAAYATSISGTWTLVTLSGNGVSASGSVVDYVNGLFIACSGDGYVSTSSDGISWTLRYSGAWAFTPSSNAVDYGNGHYVVRGKSGAAEYLYSADGTTWSSKTISGFSGDVMAIIYWNGTFYAFDNTHVATTTTPQTAASWSVTSTTFAGVTRIYGVASCPQRLVIFGNGSASATAIAYSTDGISWSAASVSSALGATAGGVYVGYVRT